MTVGMDNPGTIKFYTGLHQPSDAKHFDRCMISVNRLENRKSDFQVNDWIMDSGAFTRISSGKNHMPLEDYADQIRRWSNCGKLKAAVSQDYMCEPFMLDITSLTVIDHQRMTCLRYRALSQLGPLGAYIMPVLQGYEPDAYVRHIDMYGLFDVDLAVGAWVGVGSVCRRNSFPGQVWAVLEAIKRERPDLRLHAFGLKKTALGVQAIRDMLESADSMAWSFAGRMNGGNGNDWREAEQFTANLVTQPIQGSLWTVAP